MKIRITKKGLPKAQMWNSVVNNPQQFLQLQPAAQPNYNWTMPAQTTPVAPPSADPLTTMKMDQSATPVDNPAAVMPIKRFNKKTWMNANDTRVNYAAQNTNNDVRNFLQNNPVSKAIGAIGTVANTALNVATPIINYMDQKKQKKENERAYRESLFNMQPVNYIQNRGDYEQNTGMVDPYNTGAKSKGQYAGWYYPSQMQEGGPLSYSSNPVREDVYVRAPAIAMNTGYPDFMPGSSSRSDSPVYMELSSDFEDYARAADAYIKRVNPKTDITGEMLAAGAQNAYQKYGKIVPVQLALAQLQQEGYLAKGSKPNKPQRTHNPFNVGNTDDGSTVTHRSLQSGINTYFDLMARYYLKKRTPNQLLENFVNNSGNRYATDENYENALKKIIRKINSTPYQDGGSYENPEPMKIRITQGPTENMAYGGQLGYGFDLGGRRIYTDMPESKEEAVSNTLGPVPREEANIEAEKGEVYVGDVDNDGMDEHMKIGGKRHSEGGTPLNVDKGFIFSDTNKMKIKDPQTLATFGKSYKRGGYTPAQIAKQYNLNKYKSILEDPNADHISKVTAQHMLNNYNQKLGMLALLQEGKKGFPQGIPDIASSVMPQAKYGGFLEQYQTKGEVTTPRKVSKSEFEKLGPEWKRSGNRAVRTWPEKIKDAVKGTPGGTGQYQPGYQVDTRPGGDFKWEDILNNPNKFKTFHKLMEGAPDEDKKKAAWELYTKGTMPGKWIPPTPGTPDKPAEYKDLSEEVYYEEPTIPKVPEFTPPPGNPPYGWTAQDRNNLGLALLNRTSINRYSSVRRDINPDLPDFRNMDWRGKAAELQGTYNSQMNTMGTYGPAQGLAANASFMAGQQAENLINRAIEPTEQQNVQIYNQVAGQRSGILNQALANNAQNTFLRSQDRAILNQQYDNAVRDANKALVMTTNQGLTNAAGIYNTNLTESPYYYFDPRTQRMQFNSEGARAAFEAARKNASPNQGNVAAQANEFYKSLSGMPDEVKNEAMKQWFASQYGTKGTSTSYPYNPKNNKTVVPFADYNNVWNQMQYQNQYPPQ